MDYPIIIDLWEENAKFDEQQAKDAGVIATIIRFNDMNGGHHMDTNALAQWEQSAVFKVRMWYFVFNPWKKGNANWEWLKEHAPAGTIKKFTVDIEVKYSGISTKEYANQVFDFVRLARLDGCEPVIYTGSWFLEYLNRWPTDVDYWWARYPDSAKPSANTWAELVQRARALSWTPDLINGKNQSPGPVRLWQVSDKWSPPGCYGHAIDVNIFNGNETECLKWFGVNTSTIPTQPAHWYDGLTLEQKVDRLCKAHEVL